ncbi:MAG: M4 family metallopeptidase [Bacteroidia bacterium]|nr:M4 family metallopeptidase [Bacteroidia bacterium]
MKNPIQALFLGIILLLPFTTFASGNTKKAYLERADHVRVDEESGKILYLSFLEGKEVSFSEFGTLVKSLLELSDDVTFDPIRSERDNLGLVHHRFQQKVNGYPVLGGVYIAHVRDGKIVSVNGDHFTPAGALSPVLAESAALNLALAKVNGALYKWEVPGEEAYIKTLKKDANATWFPHGELEFAPVGGKKRNDFRLCWKFDIYAIEPLYRAEVYVDASTGEVIFENNLIHTSDVQAIAVTKYSDTVRIITDSLGPGNGFRLYESGRGGGIHTRNMQNGTQQSNYAEFTDPDNFWNNFNANLDEVAGDGHYALELTYDYYIAHHNRNSFDNQGSPLIANLHYDNNYQNAFWDGNSAQFGDGGGLPFGTVDITGHEVSHGVVGTTAGLVYQDEPGALNESFADIFGNSIEHFGKPAVANWRVGEDMTSNHKGLRNMANPQEFSNPDTYFGTSWSTGTFDNGGVHNNSGVQNFWYYLLVEGGSGTNDNNHAYSVQGLGWDTASAIAYRGLNVYLTNFSDYADARFYSIQAANDLYGNCGFAMEQTMNAWHAVGVGSAFAAQVQADFTEDYNEFCFTPGTVQFTNISPGALSSHWNFGDGNISQVHSPSHTYFGQGQFTVTLIVTGCNNSKDTLIKPNYIVLDPGAHCNMNMPQNSLDSRQSCTGTLWDSGGPTENYLNSNTSRLLIDPPGAISITLTFTSFSFATTGDYLQVYDGSDENAPLIGTFQGSTLPNGGSITSSGPTIFLKEASNGFQNFPGFELEWSCAVSNDPELDALGGMRLYPNPSNGSVRLDFSLDQSQNYVLSVTNLLGERVFSENGYAVGIVSRKMDLSHLPAGMYLVNLESAHGVKTAKLILE